MEHRFSSRSEASPVAGRSADSLLEAEAPCPSESAWKPELITASLLLEVLRVVCGVPSLTFERAEDFATASIGRHGRLTSPLVHGTSFRAYNEQRTAFCGPEEPRRWAFSSYSAGPVWKAGAPILAHRSGPARGQAVHPSSWRAWLRPSKARQLKTVQFRP